MEAAARAALIVVAVALLINFAQGGRARVRRWTARTLTGRDLLAPVQGPPAPTTSTSTTRPATPTHYIAV